MAGLMITFRIFAFKVVPSGFCNGNLSGTKLVKQTETGKPITNKLKKQQAQ